MAFDFSKVRDVANMVARTIGISESVFDMIGADLRNQIDALENRSGVLTPTSKIVNFAWSRVLAERIKGGNDIRVLDLIANLFSFVAKDGVRLFVNRNVDQIR